MDIKIFSPEDYTDMLWDNGSVQQLLIMPKDASFGRQDFLLRMSIAHITAETAQLSVLPNIDRFSMLIDGSAKVAHNGKRAFTLHPFKPYFFSGDDDTAVKGRCMSFNVMLRHTSYEKADLFVNDASAFDLYPYDGDCYLYIVSGSYELVTPDGKHTFDNNQLIHLTSISYSKIRRLCTDAKMIVFKLKW